MAHVVLFLVGFVVVLFGLIVISNGCYCGVIIGPLLLIGYRLFDLGYGN